MFRFPPAQFRRIVLASAVYDLVLTLPLATPWTYGLMHEALSAGNVLLGGEAFPAFEPLHMMMTNMLGTVVLIWSLVRIRHPSIEMGRWDGIGRFAFTVWMARTFALQGAPVMALFILPELAWGVAQWWPVKRERSSRSAGSSTIGGSAWSFFPRIRPHAVR